MFTLPPMMNADATLSFTLSSHVATRGVILVVDDQMPNIQVVGTMLTHEGYEVIPATSGAQALQRIAARMPDLVLLDVVMPDMDGFELCRRLREQPETATLPVIFVSAANDTSAVIRGLEAGGMDYVTKPFNKTEMLARVRNQVELQRARETAARVLRERESIVSMVAHDLKNPVGAIRFSAQTLAELDPSQQATASELIKEIVMTCDHIVNLVDHFLSNRAHEAALNRVKLTHISGSQIADMLSAWRQVAKRKQIILTVQAPVVEASVRADLLVLGQILDNLMSNAVKFSPSGGRIDAGLEIVDGGLVVSIQDEGPGFSESDHPRMFQEYTRLSARPTGGESSTGLGLCIAKRGSDKLGAELSLENRTDTHGAIAKLKLPLWTDS